MVMKLTPPARVILDVGAQILELSNLEVARCWLALSDASVQAVVFFDGHDELSVVIRKDPVEGFQTSSFAMQLDVCLVFRTSRIPEEPIFDFRRLIVRLSRWELA
ncbi:hypothetical protein LTR35_017897 [Friedmanniomyces endolithicus]|nr:hypothetical protein LTR35_017897 [Friedmanniomyces endolithicus]